MCACQHLCVRVVCEYECECECECECVCVCVCGGGGEKMGLSSEVSLLAHRHEDNCPSAVHLNKDNCPSAVHLNEENCPSAVHHECIFSFQGLVVAVPWHCVAWRGVWCGVAWRGVA